MVVFCDKRTHVGCIPSNNPIPILPSGKGVVVTEEERSEEESILATLVDSVGNSEAL